MKFEREISSLFGDSFTHDLQRLIEKGAIEKETIKSLADDMGVTTAYTANKDKDPFNGVDTMEQMMDDWYQKKLCLIGHEEAWNLLVKVFGENCSPLVFQTITKGKTSTNTGAPHYTPGGNQPQARMNPFRVTTGGQVGNISQDTATNIDKSQKNITNNYYNEAHKDEKKKKGAQEEGSSSSQHDNTNFSEFDPQQSASVSRSHNRVTNIFTTVKGDGNYLSGGNAAGRDLSQHQDIYTVALIVVLVAVFFALLFNLIRFL